MNISYRYLHKSLRYGFIFMTICALLLLATKSSAQVVVEMKLDTAEILVGQQVQLSTKVSANANQKVSFPSFKKGEEMVKGLEIIDESRVDTNYFNDSKRVQLERKYTITSFDSAIFNIPPMEVLVDGDTVKAKSALGLKVNVIPVDTTQVDQFAGPHAVVPAAFYWRSRLTLLSVILWGVLIAIFIISIKLTRRKPLTTKKVIKPNTPPNKQAVAALKPLDITQVKDQEDMKRFHIQLTDALRVYIQRRFDVLALEKTTDEILSAMEDKVSEKDLSDLQFIFETADLVKFAKFSTSEFDMNRSLNAATHFLENTIDEVMENPQPEVQIVVLNDGMQKKFRNALWVAIAVLGLGGLCFAYYISRVVYLTFL